MHSLPLFHRIAGERVVVVGEGEMATAKRRLVERAGGICIGETQADEARLAFVALDDVAAAEAAAGRLKRTGLLVNVADRPELCDFTLPSVLERGDVLVAVSTGGASAGLAKQLRLRLEGMLPASLGTLASALANAKGEMRRRWPDAGERRRALDEALAQGGALDPLDAEASAQVAAWLDGSPRAPGQGVRKIALTSDDPDDLTLRQARLLGTADAIVHDADVPAAILARARADAVRVIGGDVDEAPLPGLIVILRSAPRAHGDDWFHYTRRAGRFTATPANATGWMVFIACLIAIILGAWLAMRAAMSVHPVLAYFALFAVVLGGVLGVMKLAVRKGRRVD